MIGKIKVKDQIEKNEFSPLVDSNNKEPIYKIINSYAQSISFVAIPLVIAVMGYEYTETIAKIKANEETKRHTSQQRTEYIKMALQILNSKPSVNNINTRKWAVEIINHYSEIKMNSDTEKELINQSTIYVSPSSKLTARPNHTFQTFKWVGDTNSSYSFEIEKQTFRGWEFLTGASVNGTQHTSEVPINTNLRWRASLYNANSHVNKSKWIHTKFKENNNYQ